MSSSQFSGPDPARSRLRATVAATDREISLLQGQVTEKGTCPSSALVASWADLVEQLALGPEPEVRECPFCKHIVMRAATRCGYCWRTLIPPAERDGAAGAHRT
jgi:hypothetical protein